MDEYTNLDMLKSLVKTVELLTEENKELRQQIEKLQHECVILSIKKDRGE